MSGTQQPEQTRRFLAQQGDASVWLRYHDEQCAIVEVSRGMGPRAMEQWFQSHGDVIWPQIEEENGDTKNGMKIHILTPHYRAYLQNLVWIAKDRECLKEATSFNLTMHAIVQGIPQATDIATLAEKNCHVGVLRSVPSNTAGFLSLVSLTTSSPVTKSKFFRCHLMDAGFPILGKAQGSRSFRGQRLLMSTVRLQVSWNDNTKASKQRTVTMQDPSPASFTTLLEKEKRFWQQRQPATGDSDQQQATSVALPRAYQDGYVEFGGIRLTVTQAVMIPRPGSLTLVECAELLWRANHPTFSTSEASSVVVLDLGTGSGCLLVALLQSFPLARGYGVDISAEALCVAETNATQVLGDDRDCHFVQARFADTELPELATLVVCNPPYHLPGRLLEAATLRYEPAQALFVTKEGCDGLSAYREAWGAVTRLAGPGAVIVMEICRQNASAVYEYLHEQGLQQISMARDSKRCIRSIQGIFDPLHLRKM